MSQAKCEEASACLDCTEIDADDVQVSADQASKAPASVPAASAVVVVTPEPPKEGTAVVEKKGDADKSDTGSEFEGSEDEDEDEDGDYDGKAELPDESGTEESDPEDGSRRYPKRRRQPAKPIAPLTGSKAPKRRKTAAITKRVAKLEELVLGAVATAAPAVPKDAAVAKKKKKKALPKNAESKKAKHETK
jgi:hypothetical protein